MDIRIEQDPRDKKNKHFGCGKWHLVQIFVEVLGVWPTKSTIDVMLKIFHTLKLFQLLPSSIKLL